MVVRPQTPSYTQGKTYLEVVIWAHSNIRLAAGEENGRGKWLGGREEEKPMNGGMIYRGWEEGRCVPIWAGRAIIRADYPGERRYQGRILGVSYTLDAG
ncbi:hypothetical protein PHLCEN_2v4121 [Hermanssonia centrifuga]|uniref:Uncharacterized protein n=1 Tax=Hermanssonia centrifuga TaxID=98765 RepID=A0A2R6P1C9_9APHY|nr:hypothetical protein PHLCEN_2v5771 [Hermanssonia centrifuga]PSR99442.1 hypothetical protein PHLCEN_2v4121 [Hermanssonia centrifuga]